MDCKFGIIYLGPKTEQRSRLNFVLQIAQPLGVGSFDVSVFFFCRGLSKVGLKTHRV